MDVLFIIFMALMTVGYFILQRRVDSIDTSINMVFADIRELARVIRENNGESHENRQLLWKEVNKLEKERIENEKETNK